MSEPVFDAQLVAIAKCQDALADFANFERWQILDYLAVRYGRVKYVPVPEHSPPREPDTMSRPTHQDIEIGRRILRNWCRDNNLAIDPVAASDLVQKIAEAIAVMSSAPAPHGKGDATNG